MERNDPCWCGSGKKYKKCHMPIEEKIKLHRDRGEIVPSRKLLKTPSPTGGRWHSSCWAW